MNSRDALIQLSTVCGGIIATPIAAAVLAGCRVSGNAYWRQEILSTQQNKLVTVIAEHIIPRTDTPGATDVDVNRFIDIILTDYISEKQRNTFFKGLQEMQIIPKIIKRK